MATAPLNIIQYLYHVYESYFEYDGENYDWDGPEELVFTTVDAFIEDLRTRMNDLIKSPVPSHYYKTTGHHYELDRISYDGNTLTIYRKRELTKEELQAKEKAKEKAAKRKADAAEKKRKEELALLDKLKAKYENQPKTIET